jgi:hypothetical protein
MSYDNLSSVSQNVLKFYQQLTGEEKMRTDGHGETSIPPYNFVVGGIKIICKYQQIQQSAFTSNHCSS